MAVLALMAGPGWTDTVAPATTATARVAPVIPASSLALSETPADAAATIFTESVLRRTETVFLIALPFTTLYAAIASVAVALAIEGKRFKLDSRVTVPAITLAVGASAYVVWQDHRASPPPSP